jgi:hypothetical protein
MSVYIQVVRHPYEEPYHLNLVMSASNGRQTGELEFYLNADTLGVWASEMEKFPVHAQSVLNWELGSEYPEDRFAFYFRFRLFTANSRGHCAIQLRFNNNAELPEREVSEFCIRAEPSQINRLGALFRGFSKLQHRVLRWSLTEGGLYASTQEAEQSVQPDRREDAAPG